MVDKIIVESIFRSNGCIFANVTVLKGADSRVATYKIEVESNKELPTEDYVIAQLKNVYDVA
jgi:hypothetical protein